MTARSAALLDAAVDGLGRAATLADVQRITRTSARMVSGAHGATLVLRDGDQCYYVDEDAMSPLWKGQRFPVTACISGWAMLRRESVVIPDIRVDERIPQEAYRPTFVRSLAMVPVRVADPVGAIGAYWATLHRASAEEVAGLEALAAAAGSALERIQRHPLVGSAT
jgi:GAF domain-containing protein